MVDGMTRLYNVPDADGRLNDPEQPRLRIPTGSTGTRSVSDGTGCHRWRRPSGAAPIGAKRGGAAPRNVEMGDGRRRACVERTHGVRSKR